MEYIRLAHMFIMTYLKGEMVTVVVATADSFNIQAEMIASSAVLWSRETYHVMMTDATVALQTSHKLCNML